MILRQTRKRHNRTTRSVIAATLLRMLRFVIDGTNLLLLHGRANPELRYVLALCEYFEARGIAYACFFDANTDYLLKEQDNEQYEVFRSFTRDGSCLEKLVVVPSGIRADDWLLARAKSEGAGVISNDKFRKRGRRDRWIWRRRHPVVGTRGAILLETLGLELPVLPGAKDYLRRSACSAPSNRRPRHE